MSHTTNFRNAPVVPAQSSTSASWSSCSLARFGGARTSSTCLRKMVQQRTPALCPRSPSAGLGQTTRAKHRSVCHFAIPKNGLLPVRADPLYIATRGDVPQKCPLTILFQGCPVVIRSDAQPNSSQPAFRLMELVQSFCRPSKTLNGFHTLFQHSASMVQNQLAQGFWRYDFCLRSEPKYPARYFAKPLYIRMNSQ